MKIIMINHYHVFIVLIVSCEFQMFFEIAETITIVLAIFD